MPRLALERAFAHDATTATPDFQRVVVAPVYDCGTASALARLSVSRPMTDCDIGVRRCPAPSAFQTIIWLSACDGHRADRDATEDAMPADHARKKTSGTWSTVQLAEEPVQLQIVRTIRAQDKRLPTAWL